MLDELRRMVDLDLKSIDLIAVAAGPGSFTGLRIGSATAKGLGFALDIPLAAVPTVDALAYNLYGCEQLICPMMDARRGQVYTGIYTFVNGEMQVIQEQCAISVEELAGRLKEECEKYGKKWFCWGMVFRSIGKKCRKSCRSSVNLHLQAATDSVRRVLLS